MTDTLKIKVLGRCTLDENGLQKEMPDLIYAEVNGGKETYKKIWQSLYNDIYSVLSKEDREIYNAAYDKTFKDYCWRGFHKLEKEDALKEINKGFAENLNEDLSAAQMLGTPFKCYLRSNGYCVVSLSGTKDTFWLFPEKFISIEEYINYDQLTGAERRAAISGKTNGDLVTASDISLSDARIARETVAAGISSVEEEIEDVKQAKTKELAALQADIDKLVSQMEAKKKALLDVLNEKKAEMEEQMEQMNNMLFRLESEIYAIRCYTGENVTVSKLRAGSPANPDTPVVFYQKIRYMDEELGKIAGIKNIDFSDAKHFEQVLKENDTVVDNFLPAKRGVTLIRVSKTNCGYTRKSDTYGLLEAYEKWHGNKIAILIRDGENLYLSWTDDDKIYFSEDAFLKPGEKVEEGAGDFGKREYESEREYQKRIKNMQKKELNEALGRYYVFSLLQGMLDRGLILLPEKTNIANSEYFIFSHADGWLETEKYGTFEQMIRRCNASVKTGDMILMTSYLRAYNQYSRYDNGAWHNDRGRGEKNRTHDVSASDNTVYPINLIEHRADYRYKTVFLEEQPKTVTYIPGVGFKDNEPDPKTKEEIAHSCSDREYEDLFNRDFTYAGWYRTDAEKIEGSDSYDYFISLKKTYSYSEQARANFQVYKEEFINLTFMNSVWLKYVLTNNKTGHVKIGGQIVDFAYLIPYINSALEHCRKREQITETQIYELGYADILQDEEWPAKMSEWMLENDIHNFSKFRTKQFCKAYERGV